MPAPGHLKRSQRENLLSELKKSNSPHLTQRILILLLMDDGKTYQEISVFFDCGYRTVAYWCVHGDPDNIKSFHDKRENGNYRKATDEYIKLLMETIEKEPIELGYEFGRWSTSRLATYLAEVTGIDLSGEQVRRILQKKSILTCGQNIPLKTNKT